MTQPRTADALARHAQKLACDEIFGESPKEEAAFEVAENAYEFCDRMIERALSQSSLQEQPVCATGCASCCHLHTTASAPEVLLIAEHLRIGNVDHLELKQRLNRHIASTTNLSATERRRLRLPCPLLSENTCMVYEARPLVCRGWNSLNLQRCEADLAHPDLETTALLNVKQYRVAGQIAQGLAESIQGQGLDAQPLDMVRALAIALEVEDADQKWLDGQEPFREAMNDLVFAKDA